MVGESPPVRVAASYRALLMAMTATNGLTTAQPSSTTEPCRRPGNPLKDAIDGLEGDVDLFDNENWKEVVPDVQTVSTGP